VTNGDLGNGSRRRGAAGARGRGGAGVGVATQTPNARAVRSMHPEVALARAGSDNLDLIRAARWRTRSIHSSTVEGLRCRGRGEGGRNLAKSSHSLDLPRGRVNDPQLPHPRRFSRLFFASFFLSLPPSLSLSLFLALVTDYIRSSFPLSPPREDFYLL